MAHSSISGGGDDTVAAVIVTYNRLGLLKDVVAALRAQTRPLSAIIVVNNSSTDGTAEWLAEQKDLVAITQENKGGAFGFYTAIKTAYERGYEWIWAMDDDGNPAPDALAMLLAHRHRKPCVMNCLVLNKDNPSHLVFPYKGNYAQEAVPQGTIEKEGYFFNGTLFHRDVVQHIGYPNKDLVIWGDETEYGQRILKRSPYDLFVVTDSFHYHPESQSKFYLKEWDLNNWRMYFFIRNKIYSYKTAYRSKFLAYLKYFQFLLVFLVLTIFNQKRHRLRKCRFIIKAFRDGINNDLSLNISDVNQYLAKLTSNGTR